MFWSDRDPIRIRIRTIPHLGIQTIFIKNHLKILSFDRSPLLSLSLSLLLIRLPICASFAFQFSWGRSIVECANFTCTYYFRSLFVIIILSFWLFYFTVENRMAIDHIQHHTNSTIHSHIHIHTLCMHWNQMVFFVYVFFSLDELNINNVDG